MLHEEHYKATCNFFGCDDFDRLFVLNALEAEILPDVRACGALQWAIYDTCLLASVSAFQYTIPQFVRCHKTRLPPQEKF